MKEKPENELWKEVPAGCGLSLGQNFPMCELGVTDRHEELDWLVPLVQKTTPDLCIRASIGLFLCYRVPF
jgi:hypothetical protein